MAAATMASLLLLLLLQVAYGALAAVTIPTHELAGGGSMPMMIMGGSEFAGWFEIAGKGGKVEYFGGLPKSAPTAVLNTNHLHYKELIISGSYSEKMTDFQASQALIQSGRFPADRIITHSLPLERMTEAFPLMESGEALKVCILPKS